MAIQRVLLVGATALLVAACENGTTSELDFEPQVVNVTDNFEFEVGDLDAETQSLNYFWENTGTVANVNQDGSVFGGNASLEILDAREKRVYFRDLGATGTFTTTAGEPGSWTIRIVLAQVGGMVNFRVQKRP